MILKNVFIIGSKGIPAQYGGFETFVDELVSRQKSKKIRYYVSCLSDNEETFKYKKATCFNVKVPNVGSAKAVVYDILAIRKTIEIIVKDSFEDCVVYILACRIGPFMRHYKRMLEAMGVKVYVNPDGHEWKRSKWNALIKKYWKISEQGMIKNTDMAICDSKAIDLYIRKEYYRFEPKTKFISYGSEVEPSKLTIEEPALKEWFEKFNIKPKEYYLIVGRFVPENNYETMIKEFMASKTKRDLVIITNVEENKFYTELKQKTNFETDSRIKFVGTLYGDLVKKVREEAYAYIHGHEVGGTNPSLLEALGSTNINLLLDVVFNKEVGEEGALYFTKEAGSLANLIDKADYLTDMEIKSLGSKAKLRIKENYSWDSIVDQYEELFLGK
jgi:rhamnosyltransferase